ncbi:MAG: MbnH family di-heme enzyme [Vicinamibacterales bacterium]
MTMRTAFAGAIALWLAVAGATTLPARAGYSWSLPAGVRPPQVPPDNPMSDALVELGRHLFYDTRLSANGTQSCAACHEQARAFTDGKPHSVGSTGQAHVRSSMSLVNVAYAETLTWANPAMTRLEHQALVPMYGTDPVELGLDRADTRWLDRLSADATYRRLLPAAFPGVTRFTVEHVTRALAGFERALVSMRSPYDRYHFDRDDSAISASAKRGEMLFHSRPLSCFTCHGGVHFSNAMSAEPAGPPAFRNNGLYNLRGPFSYPASDTGLHRETGRAEDVGLFKTPSLRNIAVTAPYMHDGSVATLGDVIDHYADGGRTIADGPNQGVGHDNPNKSEGVRGFWLTPGQRADLLAFLESLTDEALLGDPRFADPWPGVSPRR